MVDALIPALLILGLSAVGLMLLMGAMLREATLRISRLNAADPERLLRRRLDAGEITAEEYEEARRIVNLALGSIRSGQRHTDRE